MPGFDRTGPLGQGAGRGRGLGACTGNNNIQGKPGCRRRGGMGFQRGMRSGGGFGQGQGCGNQMRSGFSRTENLIPEEDNFAKRGWFGRRNRIWAK